MRPLDLVLTYYIENVVIYYHIDQSCCMYEEAMPSIMLTQRQLSVAAAVTYV